MRGPGSIPTGGNILSLDFFHVVKPLMPILALLPILSICEIPEKVDEVMNFTGNKERFQIQTNSEQQRIQQNLQDISIEKK